MVGRGVIRTPLFSVYILDSLIVIGAVCFGQDNIIFSNIWFQFMIKDMNLYGV